MYILQAFDVVLTDCCTLPGDRGLPGQQGKHGAPGLPGEKSSRGHVNVNMTTGAVYIRWGRTSCPAGAQLLYKGETALGLV